MLIIIILTSERSEEISNVMTTKGLKIEHCYPMLKVIPFDQWRRHS